MTRRAHFRTVAAASLPFLVVILPLAMDAESAVILLSIAGWCAGVAIAGALLWRRFGAPARDVIDELDASTCEDAVNRLRELRLQSQRCADERRDLATLLEDLTRSLGEGLVVVDADLRLRLVNRTALMFCGADAVDERSHLLEILRAPDVVEVIEASAVGGQRDPLLVENPRGLWEVRAFPIRGGGAVVLMSDESLVRKAAEFRRRFVQDLSHELRSPLAVLRTTVEAVEDEISPQLVDILVRQVERLDRLTRELFDLATIEAGELDLELKDVELEPVIREVIRDFVPEAKRAAVEVRLDVAKPLTARCDRRGLYRVLSNLVDNAIKYNHADGWVKLSARVAEDEVRVLVADNGEGIPAGELKAVLQRFYRVDRARTPGQGGLGLGLAIVKHLVQHMGGQLEIDSREGAGTRVTLIFPS